MKNSDRRNRYQQPFVKNSKLIFNLPLNGKILNGKLILAGTVVLSAGTTSGVKLADGGPSQLIKRVIITAVPAPASPYPGGKIVDCSVRSLLRYQMFVRERYVHDLGANVLGSGAAGTYPVYTTIPINFADPLAKRYIDTALNADPNAFQSITVEVQTGAIGDCYTGNDRVEDYSALQVQWADDRENVAGDTYVVVQEDHTVLIPAANTRLLDKAMPSDGAFTTWLIEAENTTAQTLADTVLNRVTLATGALDYDKFAKDIRQQMVDDGYVDFAETLTGLYFVDFADGMVSGAIKAAELDAKFDVSNPGGANADQLRIFSRRLFGPAQMQPVGKGASRNS